MEKGVMYIGHLPHGFYENELRQFFSQFGKVTRLRVCRSKKTGGCKGYGFIEFECDEVAKIAAETMNNYLMYERILKCYVIPPKEVPEKLFRNQKLSYVKYRQFYNSRKTPEQDEKRKKKAMKKLERIKQKLAAMGIKYNFEISKSQRESFSGDVAEKEGNKIESSYTTNSPNSTANSPAVATANSPTVATANSPAVSTANISAMVEKIVKKRSPKDRACKRKQSSTFVERVEQKALSLICTPKHAVQKAGKNNVCSTSRKAKFQTLSVRKRSPKERKCKLNRRMSML